MAITAENAAWVRTEIEQGVVAVPGSGPAAGASLNLLAGAPNPFSGATRLTFTMTHAGPMSLRVFDVHGREVRALVRDTRSAGSHTVTWDGSDARRARSPAGIYFLRLEADGRALARRVIKLD